MFDLETKEIDESKQGSALVSEVNSLSGKKYYIESYGCAMNFNDSEIVASILHEQGFGSSHTPDNVDLILVNTCSIREKAEQTVRNRLVHFKGLKKKTEAF